MYHWHDMKYFFEKLMNINISACVCAKYNSVLSEPSMHHEGQ